MSITAEDLIDRVGNLATLPSIYNRLRLVVEDMRASNRDIAALISEDVALTARLLNIANSSFYGAPANIDTITRAVTVIGSRQIIDIVMATSVLDMFEGIPADKINMNIFWRDSISCGVISRILATYRREINIERFFIAGLLHDVGRLIMLQGMQDTYWNIIKYADDSGLLLNKVEQDELGFDHCDVGALLLEKWDLPEHMISAVRFHHSTADYDYSCIDAAIVHVGEVISSALRISEVGSGVLSPLNEKAWNALSLPVSILSPALKQLTRQLTEVVSLICPSSEESTHAGN